MRAFVRDSEVEYGEKEGTMEEMEERRRAGRGRRQTEGGCKGDDMC